MTDPVSRTILLLDIEKYSDRDDVEQAYLRRMLYDITDRALESAGIDETLRLRADRGDSVMELIDANASVTALLRALLTEVPAQLRAVNRMASSSAQIRLRGVVATGYVAVDEHDGWVGSDLNHACRLLDAELLRAALRERAGRLRPVRLGERARRDRAARPPGHPGRGLPPGDGGQQERPAEGVAARPAADGGREPGEGPGHAGRGAARCRGRRGLRHRAGRGPGIVAGRSSWPAAPGSAAPGPAAPGSAASWARRSSTSTAAPPASAARWSAATSTGCPAGRSRAMCTSAARARGLARGQSRLRVGVGPGLRLSRSGAG